jgi:hypothetical protein
MLAPPSSRQSHEPSSRSPALQRREQTRRNAGNRRRKTLRVSERARRSAVSAVQRFRAAPRRLGISLVPPFQSLRSGATKERGAFGDNWHLLAMPLSALGNSVPSGSECLPSSPRQAISGSDRRRPGSPLLILAIVEPDPSPTALLASESPGDQPRANRRRSLPARCSMGTREAPRGRRRLNRDRAHESVYRLRPP